MKVWISTPCFAKAKLLRQSLEHIYKTPPKRCFSHWVIDNHYPINKEENSYQIKEICNEFGCVYIDSGKDLGLHGGLNNAMEVVDFQPEDIIVGSDPDDRPTEGFVDILSEVMIDHPSFAVLGAMFWVPDLRLKEGAFRSFMGNRREVLIHPTVEMFCIAAFNGRIVNQKLPFVQTFDYYGGIEAALYWRWKDLGMIFGYVKEVRADAAPVNREDQTLFDPEYREWKTAHVNGFKGSFEEWLKTKI